jgi:hypothetical protein
MATANYTIHSDVQIARNRKILNVPVLATVYTDKEQAEMMLVNVRRTMPRAFIKTQVIH